jgi:hypothetical protein
MKNKEQIMKDESALSRKSNSARHSPPWEGSGEVRGLRNNNPGNIRLGKIPFKGEIAGGDKAFRKFENIIYGYRAMMVILHRYYFVYHLRTITQIIRRWAPENENNTQAYINKVAGMSLLGSNTEFTWCENNVIALVLAMCYVECGARLNRKYVEIAWRTL